MYADIKIGSQSVGPGVPEWDLDYSKNGIEMVADRDASFQRACVTAFLVRGTIPQLPRMGIRWLYLLTPTDEYARLDEDDIQQEITEALSAQDVPQYYPLISEEVGGDGKKYLRVSITDGTNLSV